MLLAIVQWVAYKLPSFTIAKDGLAYLTRYYVFLKDRLYGNVFIHHFHRSDMDVGANGLGLLHCHPFGFSVSFIISGGYWEERRQKDGSVSRRLVRPFTFNWISNDVFHRVDLVDERAGAWSIFITGSRKNRTWGFWDRVSKQHIPFNEIEGSIE